MLRMILKNYLKRGTYEPLSTNIFQFVSEWSWHHSLKLCFSIFFFCKKNSVVYSTIPYHDMRLINKLRRMDSLCHLKLFIYWWNFLEQWKKYWEFLIAWYFGRNCPILVADRNRIDADWVWVIDHDHIFNAKLLVNSYERNHCSNTKKNSRKDKCGTEGKFLYTSPRNSHPPTLPSFPSSRY